MRLPHLQGIFAPFYLTCGDYRVGVEGRGGLFSPVQVILEGGETGHLHDYFPLPR